MAVSYIRLWKLLLDKKLKRVDLKTITEISNNGLGKLGKGKYVLLESLDKICAALALLFLLLLGSLTDCASQLE